MTLVNCAVTAITPSFLGKIMPIGRLILEFYKNLIMFVALSLDSCPPASKIKMYILTRNIITSWSGLTHLLLMSGTLISNEVLRELLSAKEEQDNAVLAVQFTVKGV